MQKKLIALAIAGLASTAAFAQTNVTVYGIMDGSFDVLKVDGAPNITAAQADVNGSPYANAQQGNTVNKGYFNRIASNSSYIGFKGTEDLGNGLKAIFQIETGLDFAQAAQDNTTGNKWATRDSFVGLTNDKFGTLVMGNLTGPSRALTAALDVNSGGTGNGSIHNLTGKMGGYRINTVTPSATQCAQGASCASIFDTRWSNAIAYISPTFSGFSVVGAYVADENKTPEVAGTPARTTGYDTGIKYANGPWMAAVTYNWAQFGDVNGSTADNLRVGGMYTGANWSVRAMWEETGLDAKGNSAAGAGAASTKQQKWLIGGTYQIGKANLLAQYVQAMDMDNYTQRGVNYSGDNTGAQMAMVGVEYSLSKRTMLKANYSWLQNDDYANFDYAVMATGLNGTGATIQGFSAGVRHAF